MGLCVLLVDDDEHLRWALKRTFLREFKAESLEVIEAGNGREALKLLREGLNPVIILSDIDMPEMTGLDLARQCKEEFPGIPFVLCSGGGHKDAADDLGVDYFAKGDDNISTLKEKIRKSF